MLFNKRHHIAFLIFLVMLGLAIWPAPVLAIDNEQTTVGNACSGNKNAVDWDTIMQCVSSVWQRAPLFIGTTTDNCDINHAGMVSYDSSQNLLQYCNGTVWTYL